MQLLLLKKKKALFNKKYTVYCLNFPNGKKYIGITYRNVEERWKKGNGYYNQVVYNPIKKYRWENIEHVVIQEGLTRQEAIKLEQKLIAELATSIKQNGYNISEGGETNNGDIFKKEISSYDIYGNLVKTYSSIQEAAKDVGCYSSSLGECCNKKNILSHGFQWEFGHEIKISPLKNISKRQIGINQFDLHGNFINSFLNSNYLRKELHYTSQQAHKIRQVCLGKQKSAYGYQWQFFEVNPQCNDYYNKIENAPKKVSQYDLKRNLIKTFSSVHEAALKTRIDRQTINRQCLNKNTSGSKTYFQYGDTSIINVPKRYVDTLKKDIFCYNKDTLKLVRNFDSIYQAELFLQKPKSGRNITAVLRGQRNIAYGYIWSYLKYDKIPLNYREINSELYIKSKEKEFD